MKLTSKQLEQIKKQYRLSPRQAEVIKILFSRKTTIKEIADELSITEGAASQYIFQLNSRMQTSSKSDIIICTLDFLISNDLL